MKTNEEIILMCDATLIEEMKLASDIEKLPTEFTVADIEEWMKVENITKLDGTPYPPITQELLLNYSKHTPITKKRKQKVLYTNHNGRIFSFTPLKPYPLA